VSQVDNRKHRSFVADIGVRVATAVSWVSGIFCLAVFITLMANYLQVEKNAPAQDPALKALKEAIERDPKNLQLKESARALHLVSRRSFFTNQDQLRSAGMLLFGGMVVFLAAMKTRTELMLRLPVPEGMQPFEGGAAERAASRWAVGAGAGLMIVLTLVVVYISPPEMELGPGPEAAKAPPRESAPPAKAPDPAPVPAPAPAPAAALPDKPLPANAWPAFRGPGAAGVAHHDQAPLSWNGKTGENILWTAAIPREGAGSVVSWEDRVFVAGGDDAGRELYCYSAADGKLLWTGSATGIEGSKPPTAKLSDFGTTWAPSTPATDGTHVYCIYVSGDIAAWDYSGKRVWARNLGQIKNSYGHGSSLVTHGGNVLVQIDDQTGGRLLALDGLTGRTVWEVKRDVKECWSTPVIRSTASGAQAVLCGLPLVTGHDLQTGRVLWSVKGLGGEVAPSAALSGERIFVASDHSIAAAFVPGPDAKFLWEHEDDLPDVSSPVANDKYIVMTSGSGMISCLNPETGKAYWTKECDDGFYASPVLVGDRVYVMDRGGVMIVFRLGDAFELLARNELGEKADVTAAVPAGRVYLRSLKRLYCIGEAKK
jgi:outer membrane protein assembly factor BamB